MSKFDTSDAVCEFIRAFDASTDIALWEKLVKEEMEELRLELIADKVDREKVLKETADVMYVVTPLLGLTQVLGSIGLVSEDRMAAIADMIERADKIMATPIAMFGRDAIQEAFNLVHASNMSKLGEDGKPIRRDDGKILKGPDYKAPDLSALV